MSTAKKNRTVSVKQGCCFGPRLSTLFRSKPQRRKHSHHHSSHHSSSSTTITNTSTATFSDDTDSEIVSQRAVQGLGRIGRDGVAVEKDSDDPYLDFRQSMLQMILENEIYGKDDLKELLNCFLQLNSPYYHGIILKAFTEIWNGVYSSGLQS